MSHSSRRLYAVLACLAMLLHVLGMPALASASAEARLAYGIGGHCVAAPAVASATGQDDAHHHQHAQHHELLPATVSLTPDETTGPSAQPGSPCCCACALLSLAIPAKAAEPAYAPLITPRPTATDSSCTSLRQLRPAINPRASPVLYRFA